MIFFIKMNYAGQEYPIVVELVKEDRSFEYFKVYNPKSAALFITIRSNRPMLKARGLKHKPTSWRLESGEVKNQKNFQQVIRLIEEEIKKLDPPADFNISHELKKRGPGKYRNTASKSSNNWGEKFNRDKDI